MKQIITILFLFCAFTVNAQDVIVTGPNKKQQTAKQTTHSINATNKKRRNSVVKNKPNVKNEYVKSEFVRNKRYALKGKKKNKSGAMLLDGMNQRRRFFLMGILMR